jgi:hypothetical protein
MSPGSDIGWTITSYSLMFGSLLLLGSRRRRHGDRTGLPRLAIAIAAGVHAPSHAVTHAGAASLIALLILPATATFLPKLRLAPRIAIHWQRRDRATNPSADCI